ncbi:unnamed protein product [Urochloa humidicola]
MAATPRSSIYGASAMCILLFLLAPTCFVVASSVSGAEVFNGSCIVAERDALLSFKAGITSDPTRRLRSWRGQDCCQWYGVGCSATTGHVVKLDLCNDFFYDDFDGDDDQAVHWLRGQISSSLLSLRHLKHLDLSGNALGGNMSIPDFMGSLKSLTHLDLSNMNFIGQIPPQLGNLTKLVYLDIHKDISYGDAFAYSSDVSWLANLQSLQYLDMSGVNLSAAVHWVHAVNNLPNLRVLYLSNCNLNSSTPSLLHHNLTVLEELDLSRNPFNSPAAPNWYWDVTSLKSLIIFECELSGPFPDELGNLTMLENLDMGWNNIRGMMPSTLKNNIAGDITDISSSLLALRHLKYLDLSGNALGGNMSIPKFMGSLKSLTYLDLSNMGFIGQVPPQLGNLTKLVYLDIHKDIFYGDAFGHAYSSDVSWLASLESLQHLDMSGVNLSAAVHWVHAVNNLPNLRVLYLSNCNLNSSTPSLLHHNLTVLEELHLSINPFNSPAAPNWYWDVTSLKSLKIEDCELSGHFPNELGNLTMLENLDMGWNNIKGMVPSTLKNMCSLQSIYLAETNIGGDITDLIERLPNCSWNSLQELFLFDTNITGTTLKSVLNLTALSVLFIQDNHLSGSVPVEIGTLKYLTALHIGNNSFSGVISEAHFSGLTNLKSIHLSDTNLQVVMDSNWEPPFNLSRAFLSSLHLGPQVPNWLRWQKSISYLDMSDAGLIGRIPDWFWTTFSNAVHLNLSYNQLSVTKKHCDTGHLQKLFKSTTAISLKGLFHRLVQLIFGNIGHPPISLFDKLYDMVHVFCTLTWQQWFRKLDTPN